MSEAAGEEQPLPTLLRIMRGVPTDEELAAVLGVLLLRGAAPGGAEPAPVSRWTASARPGYADRDGRPTRRDGQAWRASALPR